METLWQDFRFALRTLRKNLSVTVLAVTSLALAIAGNTAVYSLVNSFLYRPVPYQGVERLELVGERNSDARRGQLTTTSPANYLDFAERQSSFQQMAAYRNGAYSYDSGGEAPEQLAVGEVTPGFFELLGVGAAWGRPFLPEEGVAGRNRVVLLSHDFWTERYGGRGAPAGTSSRWPAGASPRWPASGASPRLLASGETLKLNGEVYDVVGVVEEDFEWVLGPNLELWVPLALDSGAEPRQLRNLFAVARLADGVGRKAAQAEMETLMAQLVEEYPEANRGFAVELLNMREDIPDRRNQIFFRLMQVALLFVLLIACANIANLLLARSWAREREIAIRSSIGASRRRIIFQLFTESMMTAAIAGILGVALGYAGMKLIAGALANQLPSFWIPTLDVRVLGYTLAVTLLGGVLFGLAPVVQTSRFDLSASLKDGSQSSTTGGGRRLASSALVIAEVAFAVAFLAGAAMMINTFKTMQSSDPGFDTDNMLIMRLDLPESRYESDEKKVAGVEQAMERLGALPGVRAVTVSNLAPRTPFLPQAPYEIEGRPVAGDQALPRVSWLSISHGYFEALGLALDRGRAFSAADGLDTTPVAVINQAMAERYWSGESPLGKRLKIQGEWREIVGVAATVRHDIILRSDSASVVYIPWAQQPVGVFGVTLRTEVAPESLSEAVRRELLAFDRNIALTQVRSLNAFVEQFWVGQRVFTVILGGFGILALILAALGTYGVLAYSVAQRTHEIGIRMAIGAGRGTVIRMIVRQGLTLAVLGIILGIPLVLVEIKAISAVFAGLAPVEPSSVVGVGLVLALVTLVASALPARRAASVDPIRALRWE